LNNSYIALSINDKIYSKIIKSDENYHSLYLISEIKKLTKENNFSLNNLDIITVNLGPGSFTGIRVALTVAKVMAGELNISLVGLTTNEILLNAFNKDILIMDARRDMYYFATKDNIELIYKDKLIEKIKNKNNILTDKRSFGFISNSQCFEDYDIDLASVMIKLAAKKYLNSQNKDEFNYLKVNANYIQTPPVFS